MEKIKILKCKECGDNPCICCDDYNFPDHPLWAAHCMTCDNCVGVRGTYDTCCNSEEEAIKEWNKLNEM